MSKLIVANWKMNGSIKKINNDLNYYLNNMTTNRQNIVFAFPFTYIAYAKSIFDDKQTQSKLASQDLSRYGGYGAYTGEISNDILLDCGVTYSIIGHSERRVLNDTDEILIDKLNMAFNSRIKPIYCVGESYKVRQLHQYLEFLSKQLSILTKTKHIKDLVVAYEPIWAIGTNLVPEMKEIEEVALFIKDYISKTIPGINLLVLYGGSVNGSNASDILDVPGIDGVLVGGASLKIDEFTAICNVV
ncbi:MAG: triose-phosphate isomerase [Neisseriaceae bacterium]